MTEFTSGVDLSMMEGVLRQYQDDSTSLIMILQQAQSIYGYLPREVIYHVAERTGNSPAKVMGVATFYSYFQLAPLGKYNIMLCEGTACHVNGAERIRTAITQELGILNGETTEVPCPSGWWADPSEQHLRRTASYGRACSEPFRHRTEHERA